MPGEDYESAVRAGKDFQKDEISVVFTRLGENITRLEEADEVAAQYLGLTERIHAEGLDGEISVKLTQLGLDLDVDRTAAHVERLADRAASFGKTVWIDMEGSPYTEKTIALYERAKARHPNTGLCLQAYLHRTVGDVVDLMALKPAIRLVKGAYAEPSTIAFAAKKEVDANYLALCVLMLPEVKLRRLRLVLATHDTDMVARAWRFAQALGMERKELEVAMLYGIRTDEQVRLAREGFAVRDLIAYGDAWYAWYLRRLAERPANVWFVARQLLP